MSSLRQLVACSVLAVGVVGFSPALPLAYQSWHGPALAGREVCGAVASSRAAAIQPRSPRPHLGSARCLCASGDTWERWGDDGDISLWGEGLGIWCPWDVVEKDGNRAVVSKQAIRAGEVICRVPASAAWLVSFDEPPAVPDSFVSQTFWNSVDVQEKEKWWFVKLAVRLLYERSLGDQSNWAPYVSMMPSHVETLVHFSEEELEELQNSRLKRQVLGEQAWLRESYDRLRLALSCSDSVSFQDWRWALDCVRSRTFKVQDDFCMCPLMDLFNHASAARTSAMTFDATLGCYQLLAGVGAQEGEEIAISYGALDNDKLLAFYGFVEVDNPWDSVILTQERVIALMQQLGGDDWMEQRTEVLRQLVRFKYLNPKAGLQVMAGSTPLARGTLSVEFSMVLLALTAPASILLDEGAAALALKIGEGVDLSKKHSNLAYNALSDLCLLELESMPTSISSDAVLLEQLDQQPDGGGRRRQCVSYRLCKKRLLAAMA